MLEHLKGIRLGIFVFFGTILLILSIFLIGNKDLIFQSNFELVSYFSTVEGLREGASIRYSGIDVGSVKKITITGDTAGQMKVVMRINSDARPFIRKDAKSSIETEGLVGNKVLVISGGSSSLPPVDNGDVLISKSPLSFGQIVEDTQGMLSYVKEITKDFSEIVRKINQGDGTLGQLINDDKLYISAEQATKTADRSLASVTSGLTNINNSFIELSGGIHKVVKNVDSVILSINTIVNRINKGEGVLGALTSDKSGYDSVKSIINNLVVTSYQAKIAAERFADNMEALKHNWLFKGYFEKRGYWERADYEKEIDQKIEELNQKQKEVVEKIKELKALEEKINK